MIDAAAARVGDMLLPTDDRNFAIEPTPIPDMFEGIEALIAQQRPIAAPIPQPNAQAQSMGVPGMPGAPMPVQSQQPGALEPNVRMPDGAVMALSQAKAKFDAMKAEAVRKADRAQTQIDDWLTECQYHGEMRKVIDDSARLGSGVIKGPYPVKRTSRQWRRGEDGTYELIMVEEIKPASKRVDPWDAFLDPSCGESIHNGSYFWERDRMTDKQIEALKGVPGYMDTEIDRVLKDGPVSGKEADRRDLPSAALSNT